MKQHKNYDICIIGAGSGGLSVAAGAAQLDLKCALIEKHKMGGDCLNTGCVPSKALLAAGKKANALNGSAAFGITGGEDIRIDFKAVKEHVQGVIKAIEPHDSVERFEGLGVDVFLGGGKFLNKKEVAVGETIIRARYFIIASGSSAAIIPFKGLDPKHVRTNETIFDLEDKPDHLAIIGGGPIGVEMAQAHRNLGCKVSLFDIGPIMPRDSQKLVSILREKLIHDGVTLNERVQIQSVSHHSDGTHSITFADKDGQQQTIQASHILMAAGRTPNVEHLGLEEAGIAFSKKGIQTDQRLRTNHKHIFAIGDVAGGPQFTHVAGYHAGIIIKNICFKMPAKVDYTSLPWVTYTNPELAHTGLTLNEAMKEYGENNVQTQFFDLAALDRSVAEHEKHGGIEVIIGKKGRVLGASILAPHAGEMISLWSLAINQKISLSKIASLIVPYPAFGELSKRAASAHFTPALFSGKTRRIVGWLQKIPFLN